MLPEAVDRTQESEAPVCSEVARSEPASLRDRTVSCIAHLEDNTDSVTVAPHCKLQRRLPGRGAKAVVGYKECGFQVAVTVSVRGMLAADVSPWTESSVAVTVWVCHS